MIKFTKKQAQKYVNQIMKDIPYNINIIDSNGYILASGDEKRVGDFHQSGKRAAELKKTVLVYKDSKGERQGANEPIIIHNSVVGVVGISGTAEEVKNYSQLLSSMVKLLLEQEQETIIRFQEDKEREDFVFKIMNHVEGEYSPELVDLAFKKYNINIRKEIIVIASLKQEAFKFISDYVRAPTFKFKHVFLFLVEKESFEEKRLGKLLTLPALIDSSGTISESIDNILQTLVYLSVFNIPIEGVTAAKQYPYYLLNKKTIKIQPDILQKVTKLNDTLRETLLVYAKHNTNIKETTSELHIHRNTVNYRLDKVQELTTIDPRNIMSLFILVNYIVFESRDRIVRG